LEEILASPSVFEHMRKLIVFLVFALVSCASIGQVDGVSNEVQIEQVDSTNIYIIYWKGHTFIYDRNHYPPIVEINY
jgi:hypothetical protein